MLNLMGSFAEFEREIMLERQRKGVAPGQGRRQVSWAGFQRKAAEVVQLRGQWVGLLPVPWTPR